MATPPNPAPELAAGRCGTSLDARRSAPVESKLHFKAFVFAAIGLAFAWWIVFLASLMAGAGHGWMSAAWSALGLLVLPVLGAAFAYRRLRIGRILFLGVAASMTAIDFAICGSSWADEWVHLRRVVEILPIEFFSWLAFWSVWQLATVLFLVRSYDDETAEPGAGANRR